MATDRGWWARRRVAVLSAVVVAVLAGAITFAVTGWQWQKTRGHPVEDTVVTSVVPTSGREHCGAKHGRFRANRLITRRSADPPDGLPATFDDVDGCNVPSVGDHQTVVRIPHGSERPEVYVDPRRSLGGVLAISSLAAGVVLIVIAFLYAVRELRVRHRQAA